MICQKQYRKRIVRERAKVIAFDIFAGSMREVRLNHSTLRGVGIAVGIVLAGAATQFIRFRGFYRLTRFLGRFVDRSLLCTVKLNEDAVFRFHLADPYWNRVIFKRFEYEPEIKSILLLCRDIPYVFLDLGANYGFWSVLASSADFGAMKAIAVEPVEANFEILSANCAANRGRFQIHCKAVAEQGGLRVQIQLDDASISNPGASMVLSPARKRGTTVETVSTVTIDGLIEKHDISADVPLIIKLDVEGYEVEVLEGGETTLERDVLLLYEDHGNDRSCKISEYVFGKGLRVFYHTGHRWNAMRDLDQIRALKTQKSRGYNFVGCREGAGFFDRLFRAVKA